MNDAERDAWLREALRHAPDSEALPPSGISEAILAKARAAARVAHASRSASRRQAPANPLVAFWDWLARPPVAAGFASVMAATLVGLMWWDRPMDEAMPHPPALSREPSTAMPAAAPITSTPASPAPTPEPGAAADARRAEPAPASAKRSAEALAKERAPEPAAKNEAPTPFPALEAQRAAAPERKSVDKARPADVKKDDAPRPAAVDRVERTPESAQPSAPPALAERRLRADERQAAAPAESDAAKAMSAIRAASPAPAGAPTPAAPGPSGRDSATSPARDNAAAQAFGDGARRQRAIDEPHEKEAAGFATRPAPGTAPDAPVLQPLQRGRSGSAALSGALGAPGATTQGVPAARTQDVAPARVLAAIAADPERWSRQTAAGGAVALDAGWRSWLADLEATAAGRWRPVDVGAAAANATGDSATTVRLASGGRVAAVVRIAGTTVEIDASPGGGADRWQASLSAAAAARLRSMAGRLSP